MIRPTLPALRADLKLLAAFSTKKPKLKRTNGCQLITVEATARIGRIGESSAEPILPGPL
jgi:hypothetical protein